MSEEKAPTQDLNGKVCQSEEEALTQDHVPYVICEDPKKGKFVINEFCPRELKILKGGFVTVVWQERMKPEGWISLRSRREVKFYLKFYDSDGGIKLRIIDVRFIPFELEHISFSLKNNRIIVGKNEDCLWETSSIFEPDFERFPWGKFIDQTTKNSNSSY